MDILEQISNIYGISAIDDEYPFEILDQLDDLVLIHYKESLLKSLTDDVEQYNRLKLLRGTIFDTSDDNIKVVCTSYGYIPTIVSDTVDFLDNSGSTVVSEDGINLTIPSKYSIYPIYEGTMIRVWLYNGNLMLSTYKKIDFSGSKWGYSDLFINLFLEYAGYKYDDFVSNFAKEGITSMYILMDQNTMMSTKFDLNGRPGLVIKVGEIREQEITPTYNTKLIKNTTPERKAAMNAIQAPHTDYDWSTIPVLSSETFFNEPMYIGSHYKNKDVANGALRNGWSLLENPREWYDPFNTGEGVVVSYYDEITGRNSLYQILSSGYNWRRNVIVNGNYNIQHRLYEILTQCLLPKNNEVDTYRETFGIQLDGLTDEDLTKTGDSKRDTEVVNNRFNNAAFIYTACLPYVKQEIAHEWSESIPSDRIEMSKLMSKNYKKIMNDEYFGDYEYTKYGGTIEYIKNRIQEAINMARAYGKLNMISYNIKIGVLRDTGENLYRMSKVFGL